MFIADVPVTVGEIVEREGFVFADLLSASAARRSFGPEEGGISAKEI
jgi:hypothetical protein